MGTNIRYRARNATLRGINAPVKVGFLQHPILMVAAVGREKPPGAAVTYHARRLLYHGKLAINKADAVHHARRLRHLLQLACLFRGHTQRFFGKDMFPGTQDLPVHLRMKEVRRAVVHRQQPRMGQQRIDISVGMGDI